MHRIRQCTRRLAAAAVSALALTTTLSLSQPWPQRTVRLILPLGAGSMPDAAARLFAERLAGSWKQPVIVEDRPGAEGLIGVTAFINMRDDHAILFSISGPITTLPLVHEKPPYDPARDLVPIASVADSFVAIAASASSNIGSLAELVKRARVQPGKLNYYAGAGALPYLFTGFFKTAGLDLVLVPYREISHALSDLGEGRLHFAVGSMVSWRAQADAGKVRYLAVTNKTRAPIAPAVPTAAEAGFPELAYDGLLGLFGPRDLSIEQRDRIATELRVIAAEPAVSNRLAALGMVARFSGPVEFSVSLGMERAKMETILKSIGPRPGQ